jgi:hypothetical protein
LRLRFEASLNERGLKRYDQFVQTFSAAVVAGSAEIEDSKRLIEFLASSRASEAIRNSGMEPLATSR